MPCRRPVVSVRSVLECGAEIAVQRPVLVLATLARRPAAMLLALVLAVLPALAQGPDAPAAQGFRLLMVEQPGCAYCRIFNRDIAPIYAASPEGRTVPLEHVQLRDPVPPGVTLASRPFVTPTFILIGPDGVEVDRMVGYLGDDFFWPYLTRMFDRAGVVIPSGPGG